MRVVHHYAKRLAFVDALETSRHGAALRDARRDGLRREAVTQPGAAGRQDVVDVDLAQQRRFHHEARFAALHFETQPLQVGGDVPRAHRGALSESEPQHFALAREFHAAAPFVIAVQHGPSGRPRDGAGEQQLLGGEIILHGVMEIQVVAREIGEDGRVESQAVNAAQRQGVRRHFHDCMRAARGFQFCEETVQVERFRRGVDGRQDAPGQMVLDGPDQRGGFAGGAQNGIDQIRRGGFAVGAGDAGEGDALVRMAIEIAGGQRQRVTAVRKLETLRQSLETLVKYHREGEPWSYRWGLYTGDALYPEVRRIYFARFRQLLFLQTQSAILENLRSLPMTPGPEYAPTYDALKAYLITTSYHDKSTKSSRSPVRTKWWAGNRGPDADRLALAQKQFDFYSTELAVENPYSKDNDTFSIEHSRTYLKQFAGAERVYAFMLAEAGKSNPPIDYNRQFPGASQAVTEPHVVPGAFSKGGFAFMKDALAHADRYFNGEQWVLGDQMTGNIDRAALAQSVRDHYYKDFVTQWRTYIKSASVVRYAGLKDATTKLALLSGNQSPLLELFALASTNTAVDEPALSKLFQPVQAVVPPGSTERFILPPNQNYMTALVTIQTSLEGIAAHPGVPNDAAAAQTVANANQAKANTKQMAQAFNVDAEGHIDASVQKLLEDPITYLDAMLRSIDTPEINAGGKALCGGFRPVLNKYPFNPNATSEASVADVNALFHKPDGMLWTFYEQKMQKVLMRQGTQYVPNPASKVTVNPAFLSFFNSAAAFA